MSTFKNLPWSYNPESELLYAVIVDSEDGEVAIAHDEDNPYDWASIVRAVNSHDALIEACKAVLRCPSVGSNGPGSSTIVIQDFNLRAIREAIALAES